jgi:hypothetical protein
MIMFRLMKGHSELRHKDIARKALNLARRVPSQNAYAAAVMMAENVVAVEHRQSPWGKPMIVYFSALRRIKNPAHIKAQIVYGAPPEAAVIPKAHLHGIDVVALIKVCAVVGIKKEDVRPETKARLIISLVAADNKMSAYALFGAAAYARAYPDIVFKLVYGRNLKRRNKHVYAAAYAELGGQARCAQTKYNRNAKPPMQAAGIIMHHSLSSYRRLPTALF